MRRGAGIAGYRPSTRQQGLPVPTVHLWLNCGFIPVEQLAPAMRWRVQLIPELRAGRFAPDRVEMGKRGKLKAVMTCRGKRKYLGINVLDQGPIIFGESA